MYDVQKRWIRLSWFYLLGSCFSAPWTLLPLCKTSFGVLSLFLGMVKWLPIHLPGEQFQPPKKCLSQHAYRNSLLEACARPLDLPLSPEAWGLWFGGCAHVARGKVHCYWRFSGTRSGGGVPQKKGGGVPEEKENCAYRPQIIATTVYVIDNTCKTVFKLFTGFRMGALNTEKYSHSRLFVQVSFSGIGVFKAPHLQLLFYTIYRESILCPVFVLWNTYMYLLYLCFCK